VTDDPIETRIITESADLHLQEFWVRDRGRHGVLGVRYEGARKARPTEVVATAMSQADRILLCPANPVTSIGPMLAVGGFHRMLCGVDARVVALSPMDGRAPFSGPAGKLLRVTKSRPDSLGVASLYADFLDTIVISRGDLALGEKIERLGLECLATETKMRGPEDELRLAKVLLGA
jgi:LPPG:FO 2-phospho-L-lactate transferase